MPSILIVEDESIVALDLKQQLQELGYAVAGVAASGERAVALVAEHQPRLVLMDVRLQGAMDGIQAADQIRLRHDVPVVYLTSHSDADTVARAAQTAPYGYLTKPYQSRELRAGIEVALTKARMERQLRQADQWFAHTLRCVSDGVLATDDQLRVRMLNPAAERLTGWTAEQAIGLPVEQVVGLRPDPGPDSVADADWALHDLVGQLQQVLQGGRPTVVNHGLLLRTRDGGQAPVDQMAAPVQDDDGQPLGCVLVLRDAAPRLAREAELRASDERFRAAFEGAPIGMALVTLDGGFIQANAALGHLLGLLPAQLQATGPQALAVPDDQAHEAMRLARLSQQPAATPGAGRGKPAPRVVQYEKRWCRADGSEVPTLVSASLLAEPDGQPGCILMQVHDLTEQHQAAQRLAELTAERLRREAGDLADAVRGEFLSRVSHEMRTPLNAVIGFAELLQVQAHTDAQSVTTYAQHIRAAGEHLLSLVEDLLDLHRSSRGALRIQPQAVALRAIVDDALLLLLGAAQQQDIVFDDQVPDALQVRADPTRLRQVVLNLCSNAIKYNRAGGRVQLQAWRQPDELPAQGLATEARDDDRGLGRVVLVVQDSGMGMSAEQQQRLFQPFERLGREFSTIPGTGLGLVIARSLVQEMGGSLTIHSLVGEGTRVTVELPAA